ncbi:hypothetical protein F0U44_04090 [Nocardioides humilatus]|uniref:Alpha/beta hydrolase n=1 Tax=Nocardioides humilatus TaxID=2607660 RepID=A0A5B1LPI6_9ACTN|nr:hypothetical protein [Nocardioides humilatus]KAA1421477.1 hypothetical protein F0U44_04090 [Nocardioides humilatus]
MSDYVKQAVVVIHGMGEQLPLSTLTRFIDTALTPVGVDKERHYYSRPESVTGTYESRRFLAPRALEGEVEVNAQTDFFEYHWAYKMQGNRLDDLWPTFRKILVQLPHRVPTGLRGVWVLAWALIIWTVWAVLDGPLEGEVFGKDDPLGSAVAALVSGGLAAALISYLMARVLPKWLTASFVDVVRYLDTSPRSYEARREIRKGLVDLLQALHDSEAPRYDRIVIVAHSLGAYIAYDGIAYLWGTMNAKTDFDPVSKDLRSLLALEDAASSLKGSVPHASQVHRFQQAQRDLGCEIRSQGNPWLITDFVSVGTPMYFADQLMNGKGGRSFAKRVERREIPTCPPHNEEDPDNNINGLPRFYSWRKTFWAGPKGQRKKVSRRVIYEGAPFAVTRWTNLYFPVRLAFFGDWFGGPLGPVFGRGIKDVEVTGNTPGRPGTRPWRHRLLPAAAHSLYFSFPEDDAEDSAATAIRAALDLACSDWIHAMPKAAGDDAEEV